MLRSVLKCVPWQVKSNLETLNWLALNVEGSTLTDHRPWHFVNACYWPRLMAFDHFVALFYDEYLLLHKLYRISSGLFTSEMIMIAISAIPFHFLSHARWWQRWAGIHVNKESARYPNRANWKSRKTASTWVHAIRTIIIFFCCLAGCRRCLGRNYSIGERTAVIRE